jgi:hypothetical protein
LTYNGAYGPASDASKRRGRTYTSEGLFLAVPDGLAQALAPPGSGGY